MVKLVFCLRRRAGMSPEEFRRYWRDVHAPLVASHAAALGIRRYVQLHPTAADTAAGIAGTRGAPEPFDGVAELWFDSSEAIVAARSSDEGRAASRALLEDERRFLDHSESPLWLCEEHEIV